MMIYQDSNELYQKWRDQLLAEISDTICKPCSDPRKDKCKLNYKQPLLCGCCCDRVEKMIKTAKLIDVEDNGNTSEMTSR